MAGQAINALSTKTAPETSDQLLLVGTGEPQLIDYDKLADAILNKITSKNYALDAGQMTLLAALNKLNSDSLNWQRYAVFDGVIKVKNIYITTNRGEGVLLANISAYNTPSISEQYLYIIGFSADKGNANFHKIVGDGETISSVSCADESIVLNLTSSYSSAICRVLFIGA